MKFKLNKTQSILLGVGLVGILLLTFSLFENGPSKSSYKKWIQEWYPESSNIEVYDVRSIGNGRYQTYITFDKTKKSKECSTTVFATDLGKSTFDLEEKFNGCNQDTTTVQDIVEKYNLNSFLNKQK